MLLKAYWNKADCDVEAIEPYASLIGTDGWPLDPDPLKRSTDKWLQELKANRPRARYRGKFTQY